MIAARPSTARALSRGVIALEPHGSAGIYWRTVPSRPPEPCASELFDPKARHSVHESDVPFARVEGLELLARIVRPERAARAPSAPCLIDVHGGAWSHFDRTLGSSHQRALAASGAVVVAVDFRQAPAHRYPAACEDVAAALCYVRSQADALGIDARCVGLIGSSSGGQTALEVALQPGAFDRADTEIFGTHGETRKISTISPEVAAQPVAFVLALFPVSDPLARYHYVLERRHEPPDLEAGFHAPGLVAAHRAYFGDESAMERASISRILRAGEAKWLPPVWVAQPELDQNVPVPMTDALVAAYRAAGGHIEHVMFAGEHHGFVHRERPASALCIDAMREFIARQLGSAATP